MSSVLRTDVYVVTLITTVTGSVAHTTASAEGGHACADRRDVSRRRGWDGAAVVLRAGKACAHGEERQRVSQGGKVMSGDASVNTGAVRWSDPVSAYLMVRRMQIKLHR